MDIDEFVNQLRALEARYAPPGKHGPGAYAEQLAEWRRREADREEVCSSRDPTIAWYLLLLCRRYGIRTYRRPRQKMTTTCVSVPPGFMSKVLLPQLREAATVFERARSAVIDEIVRGWLGPAVADETLFVDDEPGAASGVDE